MEGIRNEFSDLYNVFQEVRQNADNPLAFKIYLAAGKVFSSYLFLSCIKKTYKAFSLLKRKRSFTPYAELFILIVSYDLFQIIRNVNAIFKRHNYSLQQIKESPENEKQKILTGTLISYWLNKSK